MTQAAGGAAIANVEVAVYDANGQWMTHGFTDATGNYSTLARLPAGTYFARTFTFSVFLDKLYHDISCESCSPTTGTPISVTAGATTSNINFALAEGGRISGVVTQSAGGLAIANVEVDIYSISGQFAGYGYTDASGNYLTYQGLPSGSYFAVTWNDPGYINERTTTSPALRALSRAVPRFR